MATKVLIVDDSRFFQRRVKEIIEDDSRLEVVDVAENGLEAIEKYKKYNPDVITMDIEMPVMDGITAVKKIMAIKPVPIIMFSSLTTDGAKSTLDALDAGAVDFLPKKFEEIADNKNLARKRLCDKIAIVAKKPLMTSRPVRSSAQVTRSPLTSKNPQLNIKKIAPKKSARVTSSDNVKLVAIGTSTGGPLALQKVLACLPKSFPVPIIIVQHMPGSFTPSFAARLDGLCEIRVKEAEDGDVLEAGTAYLAPGSRQMIIDKGASGSSNVIRVKDTDHGNIYNPCVDTTFYSADQLYPGQILAVILTGMGADGCEASKSLKNNGSEIWAQDEESCVVFGMPGAIVEENLADNISPLTEIGPLLARKFT